jgi:hypothetical protein
VVGLAVLLAMTSFVVWPVMKALRAPARPIVARHR